MIRTYDHGTSFGICIGRPEIQGFCLGHPGCGLQTLQGLWVTFDRSSGHLIDVRIKGRYDKAGFDDAALSALVEGMRRHAEATLHIRGLGGDWRVDWAQYRARHPRP
jgi:hypothetical protein